MIGAVVGNILQTMSRFPHFWWLLILGRFVVGLSCGLFFVCSSTFVVEASPPHKRGRMVVVLSFGLVLGSLVGSVLGAKAVLGNCLRNTACIYFNSLKFGPINLGALVRKRWILFYNTIHLRGPALLFLSKSPFKFCLHNYNYTSPNFSPQGRGFVSSASQSAGYCGSGNYRERGDDPNSGGGWVIIL